MVDYAKLREQTLLSAQDEEAVTVNTRALIDKVLARYSGEWTTLRELIQNAADANATKVTIKFETLPSATVPLPASTDPSAQLRHTLLHQTLKTLVVSNNGDPFSENDWDRLKRIAEGNPDETKIGAFGVGFYSVFADCESPFISSGKQTMAFYWKGNSLFTRRGVMADDVGQGETCFVLDYRSQTSAVPSLLSICQFLSTSLTFIALESVELWLDDWNVFTLTKKSSSPLPISIPREIETRTKGGMMRISGVDNQTAQIDAHWVNVVAWTPVNEKGIATQVEGQDASGPSLRNFFSRLTGVATANAATRRAAKAEEAVQQAISEDILGISRATVFTRTFNVHISTSVKTSFAEELLRATKKPPPKTTKIVILTSSFDETNKSLESLGGTASSKAAQIVSAILPTKSGKIFIGFPTSQTTGLLAHLSCPSVIPTVERESIDLNARYVKDWNTELLAIAGVACRIAYSGEMSSLRSSFTSTSTGLTRKEDRAKVVNDLLPAAIHTLKQFTFHETTPLAKAGRIIEESFWTYTTKPTIDVLSSLGILPSQDIRIASESLSFVDGIPVVPDRIINQAKDFIAKIKEFGLISDITTSDIKKELEKQSLSESQVLEFLKWAVRKLKAQELDVAAVRTLMSAAVCAVDSAEEGTGRPLLLLRDIATFINSSRIPPELPTPPTTIPFRLTKSMATNDLQSLGWEELHIVPWVRWLVERANIKNVPISENMIASSELSASVLAAVSRGWDVLSPSSKDTIAALLMSLPIIPTKMGMKKPNEAYFPSVKLFVDLPIIVNLAGVKEKFLKVLGVRKTVELSVIFERLLNKATTSEGKTWNHVDLIKYLASVSADIPALDMNQLKQTPLCPPEFRDGEAQVDPAGNPPVYPKEQKVCELFEPKDDLRKIGLPVLQWPGYLSPVSAEMKLLKMLGLRSYPSALELVGILSNASQNADQILYERALKYFVENHYSNGYASLDMSNVQTAFLPVQGDAKRRVMPDSCFTEDKSTIFGYSILRADLHQHATKFGVAKDPPVADCAARLLRAPPQTTREAREKFTYLAGRLTELSGAVATRLGNAPIVPVLSKSREGEKQPMTKLRYVAPLSCFLGDGDEYGDIFDYVNFGEQANLFLLKVGSKHEPSTLELTQTLVREPERILEALGQERYLSFLRKVQLNLNVLKKDKILFASMRAAKFLLAYRERPLTDRHSNKAGGDDQHEEDVEPMLQEWYLASASQIVIHDDPISLNLFRQHLLVAPLEDTLEDMYLALGAAKLSSTVEQQPQLGVRDSDQRQADALRRRLIERSRLFLHEQPQSNVRHDIKWLEKRLEVQIVASISLRRTLKTLHIFDTERRSAVVTEPSKDRVLLSVTAKYDTWQVSIAMTELLLDRHRIQTAMIFETILMSDLRKLRERGYNVDRILRLKAAEQRVADEAQRRQKQEEDRSRLDALVRLGDSNSTEQGTAVNKPRSDTPMAIPGAFNETQDQVNERNPQENIPQENSSIVANIPKFQKSKSLLSAIGKTLGLDQRGQQGTGGAQGSADDPSVHRPPPILQSPLKAGQLTTKTTSSPSQVDQSLQSAIRASRPYGASSVFSRPDTSLVTEMASYCDDRPGHNLSHLSVTKSGMQVYMANATVNRASFLKSNAAGLEAFASVMLEVASVFPLDPRTMHLYYDEDGSTIAFNLNGSLFFNYRFFAQLHLTQIDRPANRAQALVYWWVVACHEVAHNLEGPHNSKHSFYTEQLIAQYFPAVASRMMQASEDTNATGRSGAARQLENTFL
ncbi:hypothetical protein MRB53_041074 [Persea americana]|nr:hypothetical protein MRB53_041074 [Persea americana]